MSRTSLLGRVWRSSLLLVAGLLVLSVLLPSVGSTGGSSSGVKMLPGEDPASTSLAGTTVPVGLTISSTGTALSPTFWGTTISTGAHLMPDEAAIVNATPARMLVWPGANGGDRVNELNNTIMIGNGTERLHWHAPETNETQFITTCEAIDCAAVMQVPGEIDDPSLAAAVVNYTEKTLGFHPAYWEIGNEPELWQYWKVPWVDWGEPPQTGASLITPSEYAWEVHNYTAVMRTADPSIRILGLAGTGRPEQRFPLSDWINATVLVNPGIAGISFHVYTAGVDASATLPYFYSSDTGPYSLFGRVSDARSAISNEINATCPGCPDPPILITELGSALSHYQFANFSRTFPGGLSMAVSELQAMDDNVQSVDVFATELNTSNSWFGLDGLPRPDYTVYSQVLSHMGDEVYPASFSVPAGAPYSGPNTSLEYNLYAAATVQPNDHDRADLLMINLNTSTNVSFAPSLPGVVSGTPAELISWSGEVLTSATNRSTWVVPLTSTPTVTELPGGLPTSWTLPPQTIALFEAFPSPGEPVVFQATGLPSNARWYLAVDGTMEGATTTNLTTFLAPGTYTLQGVPLPLPLGTFYPDPKERLTPFPPQSITVGSSSLEVPVPFVTQWGVAVREVPPGEGTVLPSYAWANASEPYLLRALADPGFAVGNWTGHGHGSYSGPGPNATVNAQSPITENVSFVRGFSVLFSETGLAPGSAWSVTLGETTLTRTGSAIPFFEGNGTFPIAVHLVPGYSVAPLDPTVSVNGGAVDVSVVFTAIVPAYAVIFQASGLPAGSSWFVLVSGIPYSASGDVDMLELPNGTYPYWVSNAGGELPSVRSGSLTVAGAGVNIPVEFVPNLFELSFSETGLPVSTAWELVVNGAADWVNTSSYQLQVANGTYAWDVIAPAGYSAQVAHGNLSVSGGPGAVLVTFESVSTAASAASTTWDQELTLAVLGSIALVVLVLVAWAAVRYPKRPTAADAAPPPSEAPPSL